jgi:hypothetical protein
MISGVILTSGGCATIVTSGPEDLRVEGDEGSTFRVVDERDRVVAAGVVPAVVELDTGDGYFGTKSYIVHYHRDGVEDREVRVETELSNWYLWGNLFSFLPIGWLLVDPYSGAMWTLQTEQVNEPDPKS